MVERSSSERPLDTEQAIRDRKALNHIAEHLQLTGCSPEELTQQVLVLCAYMLHEPGTNAPSNGADYHIRAIKDMGYPTLASMLPHATDKQPSVDDAPMLLTHLANAVLREDPHFFYHAGTYKLARTRMNTYQRTKVARAIADTIYEGQRLTALSRFDLAALAQQLLDEKYKGESNVL